MIHILSKHVRGITFTSILAVFTMSQMAARCYGQAKQVERGTDFSYATRTQTKASLSGAAIEEGLRCLNDALYPTLAVTDDNFSFERDDNSSTSKEAMAPSPNTSRTWLFLIGIDKYERLPRLVNSVRDLRTVADILTARYDFDRRHTFELYDEQATRENIIRKLEELVKMVSNNDNVLIYYEGHGFYSRTYKRGYWLPVDADKGTTSEYISDEDIQTYLGAMRSRSVLVISDACFSGRIFPGQEKPVPGETDQRHIEVVSKLKARQVLTSGGNEPVMGGWTFLDQHSLFAHYLIDRLGKNTDKFLAASALFEQVKTPVSSKGFQTPEYKSIQNAGDEGGEFLFVRR